MRSASLGVQACTDGGPLWVAKARLAGSGRHHGNGKAVVALGPHGLQRGGDHEAVAGHLFEQVTGAGHRRVGAASLGHSAAAYHVVDHDHPPGPAQLHSPTEVGGVVLLVGVYEAQVERPGAVPATTSTLSAKPARARLERATWAWEGSASKVTNLPPGARARPIQMAL